MTAGRILGKLGGTMAGVVGLLIGLVLTALLASQTSWGSRQLLGLVLPRVESSIAGDLDVDRLRLRLARITLVGVRLRDPEGRPVAAVERIEVAFSLVALLRRRLELTEVRIERPALQLLQDERGWNLVRALAPRRVAAGPSGAPSRLVITVGQLALREGRFELRSTGAAADPVVAPAVDLAALEVHGHGRLDLGSAEGAFELRLRGQSRQPVPGPVELSIRGQGKGGWASGVVVGRLASSRLDARLQAGTGPGPGQDGQVLELRELRLAPELIAALLPAWPLPRPLEMSGSLRRNRKDLAVDLVARSAGGRIRLDGGLDLATLRSPGVQVHGEHLDLSAFWAGAPRSDFAFNLQARGGGQQLSGIEGEARLDLAPGRLGGRPTGPVRVEIAAQGGTFRLRELNAVFPGLTLSARGRANRRTVSISAELHAKDLGRAAGALFSGPVPPIAGNGRMVIGVTGPWRGPGLTASGSFSRLGYGPHRGRGVSLRVRAANLRQPELADVRLSARGLVSSRHQLRDLRVALVTAADRNFRSSLVAESPQPFALRAGGQWSPGLERLTLHDLRIAYPEASWRAARPATLRIRPVLAVQGLDLTSGDQRLQLDLRRSDRRLRGRVRIRSVELARLPHLVRTRLPVLAGRLDASVAVAGNPARPTLELQAALREGRVADLQPLSIDVEARVERDRIHGEAQARAPGGRISSRFALSRAFPPPPDAPLDVSVLAESSQLGQLLSVLTGKPSVVDGTGDLQASIQGPLSAPRLQVVARGRALQAARRELGQVDLRVASRPGAPVTADLRFEALGSAGTAHLRSPLDLGRLLRNPDAFRWQETPFEATARLSAVPLETLARLSGRSIDLGGTATLSLQAQGTVASPVGSLDLAIDGLRGAGIPPTDARLQLRAHDGPAGVRAELRVSRDDRTLASARGSLALAAARLRDRWALLQAPLRFEATVGPVELQRLVAPTGPGDRQVRRRLQARLQASVQLDGSLAAPEVALSARASRLILQDVPLGDADLRVTYSFGRPRLEARMVGPAGSFLTLSAESQVDLGYPLPEGGIDLRHLPIAGRLRAERYDVTPLSCVSDLVRLAQGHLDGDATVSGKLGAPSVRGRLEWKEGRLVLAALGEYRDIRLLLRGDDRRLVLEELSARSGRGSARLTASADRQDGGAFELAARADLDRFPIRVDGRGIATLSSASRFTGRASFERLDLLAQVDWADVRLTGNQKGEVQSLERPDDVVLFWGDAPLDRAQARKHAILAQARRDLLAARGATASDGREVVPPRPHPAAELRVKASSNLWVRGPDINLELGLAPGFVVQAQPELTVFGDVLLRRGQVEALGRRFRLEDGSVLRFSGPPQQPTLEVRAVHQPRHADLTVVVNLAGPVDALRIDISSPERPEYGQTDLLAVIVTGRLPDEGAGPGGDTVTATDRAASLLGGLLADKLQATLMRRLPIDVLNIDPGEGLRALELEAGTYLSDDLYVAYVGRLGGDALSRENLNEIQLEYRLTQRWSFQTAYGDARRGAADLVWTKRY